MGKRGNSNGTTGGMSGRMRINLSEQIEWVQQQPKSALQHCLNSHVIRTYFESRAARKAASLDDTLSMVTRVDDTIQVGSQGMQAFRRVSAHHGRSLSISALPKRNYVAAPRLVPFVEVEPAVDWVEPDDENAPMSSRRAISLATHPQSMVDFATKGGACHTPTIDFDDTDSIFDAIDLDAIVANRERKTQAICEGESTTISKRLAQCLSGDASDTARVLTRSATIDTHSSLQAQIKETREQLRRIREACDDASLEGDVPPHLMSSRSRMEVELDALSRKYRSMKSSSAVESQGTVIDHRNMQGRPGRKETGQYPDMREMMTSTNPQCSCGMVTVQCQVQHGTNSNRMYFRCSTCGFHSWVEQDICVRSTTTDHQQKEVHVSSNTPRVRSKMLQAKRVLRDVFGHNAFRPNQERVVMEAFTGRDVFVLMPTGGGKSLCYQLPACIDDGITVVISPLVSLIQDQVQQLEALDIGVAHLKGDQDYETVQRPIISELFSNQIRIKMLYVTPEKIASSNLLNNVFESLEKRGLLSRFVVDEAHCISQWGHDFRKDYMQLGQLRTKFRSVPIMALTATANSQTEADIVRNLQLARPFMTRSSFNRPNLTYDVRKKSAKFMDEIAQFVREHSEDSGIIYCLSKKDCEQVSEKLIKALGYEGTSKADTISYYHAGLEPDDRAHRHHEWSKGNLKLIVATVAFGMGINKPDVRYVIHHTIPQSVTHYYQEAGRAGRDSEIAHCILYYSYPDLSRRRKLIMMDRDNLQHSNVHLQHLRRMAEFCENQVECRRTSLLEYFGEHFSSDKCRETCDNCKNRARGLVPDKVDVTNDCLSLLDIVGRLQSDNRQSTLVQIAQIYMGQVGKGKEWMKDQFTQLQGFGAGKGRFGRSEVERILYHMILRQYLREVDKKNKMGFTTTFIALGANAGRVRGGECVNIVCKTRYEPLPSSEHRKQVKQPQAKAEKKQQSKQLKAFRAAETARASQMAMEDLSDDFDEDVADLIPTTRYPLIPEGKLTGRIPARHVEALAQLLKDWRASVCDNFNVMPYHILPTTGIAAIANAVPVTSAELLEIDGVGRIRVKKYGEAIIDIVKTYLNKHKLTPLPALMAQGGGHDAPSISPELLRASPFFDETAHAGKEFDDDNVNWAAEGADPNPQRKRSRGGSEVVVERADEKKRK